MFNSKDHDIVEHASTHTHQFSILAPNCEWCLDCGTLRMWSAADGVRLNEPALVRMARRLRP